jgi:uncharacterized membrane protein YoaK (UPF0700 family)
MSRTPHIRAFWTERPPLWLGLMLGAVAVAAATAIVDALGVVAPPVSLAVVYVPVVLLLSA